MADYGWNLNIPADNLLISGIPGAIRDTVDQLATRQDIEHVAIASGADDTDSGGQHKKGSARAYYQDAAPTKRPDSGAPLITDDEGLTVSLDTTNDRGRLWTDSNDGNALYVYGSTGWEESKGVGGVGGADTVLLAGRTGSGGQTVNGGTLTTEDLTLQANAAADGSGSIVVTAANTSAINLNNVPLSGLTLGGTVTADSNSIKGVATPTEDGDVLVEGFATIRKEEVDTGGSIAIACGGTATGAGANLSADVGFAPDFIFVGNDTGESNRVWQKGMATGSGTTKNKKLDNGTIETSTCFDLVGTTITFIDGTKGGNGNSNEFYYLAIKMNKTVNPA